MKYEKINLKNITENLLNVNKIINLTIILTGLSMFIFSMHNMF